MIALNCEAYMKKIVLLLTVDSWSKRTIMVSCWFLCC